jgi:hypothetical protein
MSWSLFASTPPAADLCVFSPPAITVRYENSQVSIDHSLTRSQIGQMLGNVAFGFAAQGMTASAHSIGYKTETVTTPLRDGSLCANLEKVEITVGYSEPPTIYIASETPEGSCRYNSTLTHERRHVGFAAETSQNIVDELQTGLSSVFAAQMPIRVANSAEAQARAFQIVKDAVDPVSARHMASEQLKNLSIDTRTSYEALSAECSGQ